MPRIEKSVFICYRRKDIAWALNVYQYLVDHGYDVFFDYTGIPSGDFEQIIITNIKARAHFLVILTPTALDRCDQPEDWLRKEIETAIKEKRNIVPLFFDDFSFAAPNVAEKLTGKLATLKKYNGLEVPGSYFDDAMERLCSQYLKIQLKAVIHPVSDEVQKEVEKQQVAANQAIQKKARKGNLPWIIGGIVILAAILLLLIFGPGPGPQNEPTPTPSATMSLPITITPPTHTTTFTPTVRESTNTPTFTPTPSATETATPTATPETPLPPTEAGIFATVYDPRYDGVNVRESPGYYAPIVTGLPNGISVIVLPGTETVDGVVWAHIVVPQRNQEGWILEAYLLFASPTPSAIMTPTATSVEPGIGSTRKSDRDDLVMVYVPAGDFVMGSNADRALEGCQKYVDNCQRDWFIDEEPLHTVYLESFWIDRTEVTNEQYARCVAAGECSLPSSNSSPTRDEYYGDPEYANFPVIWVSWDDADAYCTWAGRRLPTEA